MRSRRLLILLGVLILGVALAAWSANLADSPGWDGLFFVLVTVCNLAAVMAITRSWGASPAWVAALGLLLVAAGSGMGRPRHDVYPGLGSSGLHEGDVVARLDTWWPLVIIGLMVTVGALLWALQTTGVRSSGMAAATSLLAMGVGYTVVAVALRDVVVGHVVSGRPLRKGRHRAGLTRDEFDHLDPADLWHDAAADEAAAVAAFLNLAERLTAVGAPAALVNRSYEAAVEEQRHTATCVRLANRLGSCRPNGPATSTTHRKPTATAAGGTKPRRRATMEVLRLATESFVDGVIAEGFAARCLEAGSSTVTHGHGPQLRSMAVEEHRHAVLGADIVVWARQRHPNLVHGALRRAARTLPVHAEMPVTHRDFAPTALRQVGLVDVNTADELWSQQRTEGLSWLDDELTTGGPVATNREP